MTGVHKSWIGWAGWILHFRYHQHQLHITQPQVALTEGEYMMGSLSRAILYYSPWSRIQGALTFSQLDRTVTLCRSGMMYSAAWSCLVCFLFVDSFHIQLRGWMLISYPFSLFGTKFDSSRPPPRHPPPSFLSTSSPVDCDGRGSFISVIININSASLSPR